MSKIEASGFTQLSAGRHPEASNHPVLDGSWKERLSEARAKRAKLLSERGVVASKAPPQLPEPDQIDDARAPEGSRADTGGALAQLNASDAVKALMLFSGAAGFGLGVTLGIGALIGLGVSVSVTSDPLAESSQGNTISQSNVATVTAVVDPPADRTNVASDGVQGSPQVDVPDGFFAPVSVRADAISLPEISAVQYMRADTDLAIAATLRSLPEIPGLSAGEMMYGNSKASDLQFFIHAPDGIPNDKLQSYVAELESAGIAVAEIGRERFRVSTTHLRYYSPETAAVAKTVANDLGVEARDFSANALNAERIEVWVAGRPRPSEEAQQPRTGFFARLFNPQR
ncbi:hypothetical protein [uncultured Roseobacter sp.]|uniref:hypothetical protein n=1 Tax=uncultured Roseobacter sp. TaxID=114847 RepID=UPI00261DDFD7|nr:hypothetical protein [uncultured Roseobacter sp.]